MEEVKYKAKGTIILTFKAHISENLGEDFFWTLWEGMGLTKGIILPSSWYDQDLYAEMLSRASKELGQSERELIIDLALLSIERDLNGVYKFLMRAGGPKVLLGAIPKLAKAYSNFSEMDLLSKEDGCVQIQIEADEKYYDFARWSCEGAASSILKLCSRNMKHFKELRMERVEKNTKLRRVGAYEIQYD